MNEKREGIEQQTSGVKFTNLIEHFLPVKQNVCTYSKTPYIETGKRLFYLSETRIPERNVFGSYTGHKMYCKRVTTHLLLIYLVKSIILTRIPDFL